jgi:hypothetical protein
MTTMTGRLRDLVLALVVGGLVAAAGYASYDAWRDHRVPEPTVVGDRVQRAADAIAAGDHVYVAADAHDLVPPDVEAGLETLAADSDVPVYVAVWEESDEAGYGGIYDAVGQLERLVDEEAIYVLYQGPGVGLVDDTVEGALLGAAVPSDFNGDAARRLEEIVTAAGETRFGPSGSDWDYWGGPGGAFAAGALFAAGAIPALWLVMGLGRVAARRPFRMVGGWW